MLTMIIGGLWHGAAWTFVLWGTYQGIILVGHRLPAPGSNRIHPTRPVDRACWKLVRIVRDVPHGLLRLAALPRPVDGAGRRHAPGDRRSTRRSRRRAYLLPVAVIVLPLLAVSLQYLSKDLDVIERTPWYVRSVFYTACFYAFVLGGRVRRRPVHLLPVLNGTGSCFWEIPAHVEDRGPGFPVPWGLAGMLALVGLIEGFIGRQPERFLNAAAFDWYASGKVARQREKAGRFDVLIVGDSMLKFGLAPRVVESRLEPGRRVDNLALLDGKPALSAVVFERALASGARPSALIVDGSPEALNQPAWHLLTNPHWNALMASPGEAWDLARTYHDRAFFGRLILARALPSYRCRDQVRDAINAALGGRSDENPNLDANEPLTRNRQVNRGGVLLPKEPKFRGEVPSQMSADVLNGTCDIQFETAHYVRRLIRLAAEHKVAVFWLLPPNAPVVIDHRDRSGVHARIDRFVRGLQTQFPNLTVLDARHAGYPNHVFVDPVHLDRDGAVALSTDVGDVIERTLCHSEPSTRWVNLPAYRARAGSEVEPLALEDLGQSRARTKIKR